LKDDSTIMCVFGGPIKIHYSIKAAMAHMDWVKAQREVERLENEVEKLEDEAGLLEDEAKRLEAEAAVIQEHFDEAHAAAQQAEKDRPWYAKAGSWLKDKATDRLQAAFNMPIGPLGIDIPFTDWDNKFKDGFAEGLVNWAASMPELAYQIYQDPMGVARGVKDMAVDGFNWAKDGDNWVDAANGAWDWASDGDSWLEAGQWILDNPEGVGKVVGEVAPDVALTILGGAGAYRKAAAEALEQAAKKAAKEAAEKVAEKATKEAAEKAAREAAEKAAKEAAEEIPEVVVKKVPYNNLGKKQPCFLAGTLVKTSTGYEHIEKLNIDDEVVVFDFNENCLKKKKIIRLYKNWTNRYCEIKTDKTTVSATFKHLFWIENENKWISAKELNVGMKLKNSNNQTSVISEVVKINDVNLSTYNLEIEDIHNYFVGEFGILVHNQNRQSKFESKTKQQIKIYEVYDTRTGKTKYVGQTNHSSVSDRFDEHSKSSDTKKIDRSNWNKHYDVREVASGNWTPYEAAVWEQHYIEKNGGVANLENGRNEITEKKYDKYGDKKYGHKPCP